MPHSFSGCKVSFTLGSLIGKSQVTNPTLRLTDADWLWALSSLPTGIRVERRMAGMLPRTASSHIVQSQSGAASWVWVSCFPCGPTGPSSGGNQWPPSSVLLLPLRGGGLAPCRIQGQAGGKKSADLLRLTQPCCWLGEAETQCAHLDGNLSTTWFCWVRDEDQLPAQPHLH